MFWKVWSSKISFSLAVVGKKAFVDVRQLPDGRGSKAQCSGWEGQQWWLWPFSLTPVHVALCSSSYVIWTERFFSPGLSVMWSLWGFICVTSCVAPAALLLRGLSSITCSLLLGDSMEDGAQPDATRLLLRSQRDELETPWPKSWQRHKYNDSGFVFGY